MTGALVGVAFAVRSHYDEVRRQLKRMDFILEAAMIPPPPGSKPTKIRTVLAGSKLCARAIPGTITGAARAPKAIRERRFIPAVFL